MDLAAHHLVKTYKDRIPEYTKFPGKDLLKTMNCYVRKKQQFYIVNSTDKS